MNPFACLECPNTLSNLIAIKGRHCYNCNIFWISIGHQLPLKNLLSFKRKLICSFYPTLIVFYKLMIIFLPPLNYLLVLNLSFQSHLTFSRLPISIGRFTGNSRDTAHIWCPHQFQMSSCSGTIPPPVLSLMRSICIARAVILNLSYISLT